jgi:hypothetical protein
MCSDISRATFLKKIVPERVVTQNSVGEGEMLVISSPGKKVPEYRSGLRPSEKELPVRRSGASRHKNTKKMHNFVDMLSHLEFHIVCRGS